jgi:ribonuclease T2
MCKLRISKSACVFVIYVFKIVTPSLVWHKVPGTYFRNISPPINYPGGWVLPDKQHCVDICRLAPSKPTCFTNATDCIQKHQRPGDYDSLLFDQLFLPQFCRDLLIGIDSTLAHRPVASYPEGIRCHSPVQSVLSIHGLWPNYKGGYPACCNVSDFVRNTPIDPHHMQATYPKLVQEMTAKWRDPTQNYSSDALCELWNHEFQKHGLCYTANGSDFNAAAAQYFTDTLAVARRLESAANQIHTWAQQALPLVSTSSIRSLYTKYVQVHCSSRKGVWFLSGIRSCWSPPPVKQIDCIADTVDVCPDVLFSLAPYIDTFV